MVNKALIIYNATQRFSDSFPFELALSEYKKVFAFEADNIPDKVELLPRELLIKNAVLGNPWIRDFSFSFEGMNFKKPDESGKDFFVTTYLEKQMGFEFSDIPVAIQGGQVLETSKDLFISESYLRNTSIHNQREMLVYLQSITTKNVELVPEHPGIPWSYHLDLLCQIKDETIYLSDPLLTPASLNTQNLNKFTEGVEFYKNFFSQRGYKIISFPTVHINDKNKTSAISLVNSLMLGDTMVIGIPEGLEDTGPLQSGLDLATQICQNNKLKLVTCHLPLQLLSKQGFLHCLSSELYLK